MSSRGRPPKNGTPFDRLLKKQCQKGVSASKSAGVVGKWGSASFTSIRSASVISSGSEVARPKKFFKSKNSSSGLDNDDFEPITQPPPPVHNVPVVPVAVQPTKKPPSKFFKSKSAPVVSNPAPLRPLEVTPNQPLKQTLPPAKDPKIQKPEPKIQKPPEEIKKVPPLKLRLKAGTLLQPTLPPPPPPPPVIQEKVEEEEEEDDYTASSDDNHSISDGNDVEEEISFKEPSLVINSPPNNQSPSRLTSPVGQQQHQQKVQPLRSSPEPRITTTLPSTRGSRVTRNHANEPVKNDQHSDLQRTYKTKVRIPSPPPPTTKVQGSNPARVPLKTSQDILQQQNEVKATENIKNTKQDLSASVVERTRVRIKVPSPPPSPVKREPSPPPVVQRLSPEISQKNEILHQNLRQNEISHQESQKFKISPQESQLLLQESQKNEISSQKSQEIEMSSQESRKIEISSEESQKIEISPQVQKEHEPVKSSKNGDAEPISLPPQKSYGRRPMRTLDQEPETKKFKPEPETKKFKPEMDEKPIVKSLSDTDILKDSNNDVDLKPAGLTKSTSLVTSGSSAETLMPPPPTSGASLGFIRPKKSFFKSKSKLQSGSGGASTSGGSTGQSRKGLASYKHSFGASQDTQDKEEAEMMRQKVFHKAITDMDFDEPDGPSPSDMSFSGRKLTRVTTETASSHPDISMQEVVSVKCPKAQKGYFTVIKNVKKAHQIQDSGEFQEFNDDVEYIMEGLQSNHTISTRCLSTVTLATKCMEPPFRMHLRAHGTMNQFFSQLKDAPKDAGLALCTATVLFVLSQDRLNMDMDRDSLELMLNLLDTDSRIKDALDGSGMSKKELEKNKQKVQELVGAMKAKGHATNLSLENISADHLSMETLLSLTSKRAGEWFKEELRELGGLDHLVKTMSDCLNFLMADEISMWTEPLHNKLRKAGRVLKVLESITTENEENCQYLLKYQNGTFLDLIHKLFKFLDEEVPLNPNRDVNDKESVSYTLRESLFGVMRVYINIVHDYNETSIGSQMSGAKDDTFDLVLHCLFVMPSYLPIEKRFDVLVLTLTLLINLVEHCEQNRTILLKTLVPQTNEELFSPSSERRTAAEGLVQMFLEKEENAKREESKTDAILDEAPKQLKKGEGDQKKDQKTEQEAIDETVAKLLQKAGRHMEDTLIASYVTLIIGYLIKDNSDHESHIRALLPGNDFSIMTAVLKKFYNFMNLTASSTVASNRGIKATEMILKTLEKADAPEEETKKDEQENFDDITLFDMTKDESSISLQAPNMSNSNFDDLDDDFDKL